MADELTGFRAGRTEAHAVDDVVKTAFKKLNETFAGVAAQTSGFSEVTTELSFENAVHALGLLRFTHLVAVVGHAGSGNLAVLARLGTDVLDFRLKRTTGALQIQVNAFAARKLELGTEISCHLKMPLLSCRTPYIQFVLPQLCRANAGFNRNFSID